MTVACIDLEGVLVPELWPHIAAVSGIAELAVTTREEPDYDALMTRRLAILRRFGVRLPDLEDILSELRPLDGAAAFLDALERDYRVVIVSDCFKELAAPFLPQLGKPEIRCHRFCANERGDIESCIYAGRTNKADVVTAFHAEGSRTLAIGDAFNDLAMLREATLGILFRPSLETARHAADLPCAETYEEAKGIIGRATESGIFGI